MVPSGAVPLLFIHMDLSSIVLRCPFLASPDGSELSFVGRSTFVASPNPYGSEFYRLSQRLFGRLLIHMYLSSIVCRSPFWRLIIHMHRGSNVCTSAFVGV